jgi:hypothetical protein
MKMRESRDGMADVERRWQEVFILFLLTVQFFYILPETPRSRKGCIPQVDEAGSAIAVYLLTLARIQPFEELDIPSLRIAMRWKPFAVNDDYHSILMRKLLACLRQIKSDPSRGPGRGRFE